MTSEIDIEKLIHDYNRAQTRLIVLDYDGTLVPFYLHPESAKPSLHTKSLIRALVADPKNSVILISGRDKENLEAYWGDVDLVLVAEHGGYYKPVNGTWSKMFSTSVDWMSKVQSALVALSFHYEGSFVEQKSFSIAWHYRAIADRISDSDKRQFLAAIRALPEHKDFLICDNEFTLELRTPGIDKGAFVARWVGGRAYDFILAIGDSQTDEDLFKILGKDAYSIKVQSSHNSAANYHLNNQEDVLHLIQKLINANNELAQQPAVAVQSPLR